MPTFGGANSKKDGLASNSHGGAFIGMTGNFSKMTPAIKRKKLMPEAVPQIKVNDDQVVVEKSRSKYLKSLGMVPRGQERTLEFIKSPFDAVKGVTSA